MEELSAFAFHTKAKKSKKGAKKVATKSADEHRKIKEELALMKRVLNQNGKEKVKKVEIIKKKKKPLAKKYKLDRNVSPLKVVQGLKNGHNINQVKLVKIIGDQMTSKEPKAELKMDIGLNKTSKETLMQSVRNLLNTSKERSSVDNGRLVLSKLVHPLTVDKFLSTKFNKHHHVFVRNDKSYHDEVFSTKDLDQYIKSGKLWFGKNLDVTSYEDGRRETHNPDGKASGPLVWTMYNDGCSLRLLNPQTFNDNVWMLCASLQDFFGSMVGANVYLTPPGTQGFAPHFDDVDVFIMQLEGCKNWRLYGPRNSSDILPRFSSPNFDQTEIGEPIADVVLQPGDMIYLPRGTIHQATCLPDHHSLHITVSCNQLNTYGDLLKNMLSQALETAMSNDVEFRESLPLDYMRLAGSAFNGQKNNAKRNEFVSKTEHLCKKLFRYASIDHGADQLGKRFMSDVLPPFLTTGEKQRTVVESGFNWCSERSEVVDDIPLPVDAHVRLIRECCLRLVEEEGCFKLYHCAENSREYHEVEGSPWELPDDHVPAIKKLLQNYPSFTPIDEFNAQELEAVDMLWANSLLIARDNFTGEVQAQKKKTKLKKKKAKVVN